MCIKQEKTIIQLLVFFLLNHYYAEFCICAELLCSQKN